MLPSPQNPSLMSLIDDLYMPESQRMSFSITEMNCMESHWHNSQPLLKHTKDIKIKTVMLVLCMP
jgi:hypothetical protein